MEALLDNNAPIVNLKIAYRGNTDEVLDIFCAQLKIEDLNPHEQRLLPNLDGLRDTWFPQFAKWWFYIRSRCGPSANVAKHRIIAILVSSLQRVFGELEPTESQRGYITLFLEEPRRTAKDKLNVDFPEPKGKWTSQRNQLEAYDKVAAAIAKK